VARGKVVYSVRQDGKVVAHAEFVKLREATFVVREAGRQRVLMTGRKNVHAWVRGYLEPATSEWFAERGASRAKYNPREMSVFCTNTQMPLPVRRAARVHLDREGCWLTDPDLVRPHVVEKKGGPKP
jgi:hypothetical protein